MAKKNFNLDGEFLIDTSKTQQKHNKYTSFLESELSKPQDKTIEFKRINMAFTDNNYETILSETNRFGVNMAFFINALIRIIDVDDINNYIDSLIIKRTKENVPRRKGNPSKRINLKFPMDTYKKIVAGSNLHNQTITQYTNIVIEVYAQETNK